LPDGHPPIAPNTPPAAPADPSKLPEGHPPVAPSSAAAPSADELLKKLDAQPELKNRPKTLEVAVSMGKLYYANARYDDAAKLLGEASALGMPARTLLHGLKKSGARAGSCSAPGDAAFDVLWKQAQSSGGDKAAAVACLERALKSGWVEAQTFLAKALFLKQKPDEAVKALTGLLEVFEEPEARFSRAAILLESRGEDVKSLKQAKADLETLTRSGTALDRTAQARELLARVDEIIASGGTSAFAKARLAKAQTASPPPPPQNGPALTKEMVDAVQNTERTPELEQGMAKLVEQAEEKLSRDEFQAALDDYKRVVPFQPENARARAGMAWAMVGLNRQPMADRVWSVAVSSDPGSVEKLGDVLKAKGNDRGAKAVWAKLAQSSPEYAAKAGLTSKLR